MWKYGILIIALICALFVAGCTSQPAGAPAAPAAAPAAVQATAQAPAGPTATVLIEQKAFNPNELRVAVGTTVTWINQDTVSHRVVHQPGKGESELFHSDRLDPGQSFSYTFTQAGKYFYTDPQYAGGTGFNPFVEVQ